MIFNEDYDKTLWLVLSSNKETRDDVGKLIGMLPNWVYVDIQKMISDYKMGINTVYKKSFDYVDNYGYYVIVRIIHGKLLFNVTRWKEDKVRTEEEYTLCLVPITNDELLEMEYLCKKNIGSYDSEIYDNITYDPYGGIDIYEFSRRYNIRKIPFGVILDTSLDKKIFNINVVNFKKNMPNEMFVSDFSSSDKIDALVKRKIRRRHGE